MKMMIREKLEIDIIHHGLNEYGNRIYVDDLLERLRNVFTEDDDIEETEQNIIIENILDMLFILSKEQKEKIKPIK